jgi:hypothetical protein
MSSVTNRFVEAHSLALRILAVNALHLFEVPVINGNVDTAAWNQRMQNRQLVIHMACTVTPFPFSHRFNQLEVIHTSVDPIDIMGQVQAHNISTSLAANPAAYSVCIILYGPVVEGRRNHIGGNQLYEFSLTATQIRALGGMGIGLSAAQQGLDESIMRSRRSNM